MQRQINLMDEYYTTTVSGRQGNQSLQVGEEKAKPANLTIKNDFHHTIQLGDQQSDLEMVVKGETAFIRAFGRTFTLNVIDPVEQASLEAGGSQNTACAPMPGTVVEIHVEEGDNVLKDQPMVTIESMKILTIITAPRDGEIEKINFEPGKTFDKNAVLVILKEKEEE